MDVFLLAFFPESGLDSAGEFEGRERLFEIIVRAEIQAFDFIGDHPFRGDDHDFRFGGAFLDFLEDIEAGEIGEHQIKDHEIEMIVLEGGQKRPSIPESRGLAALFVEGKRFDGGDFLIIVDDCDVFCHSWTFLEDLLILMIPFIHKDHPLSDVHGVV